MKKEAYSYYEDEKTKDRYFYTRDRIKHGQGKYYVAGIYRYYKTKKEWQCVKRVGFARKRKTMDWAYNHLTSSKKEEGGHTLYQLQKIKPVRVS